MGGHLFMLRYYNVFNLEQTTLAPAETAPLLPLASCSAVMDGWQQKPRLIVDDPKVSQAEYFPKLGTLAMLLMSRWLELGGSTRFFVSATITQAA